MMEQQPEHDCIVIGGGPAGLTAAIYLARFHLSVAVLDDGQSRAALIPLTRNHAGFPDGIAGAELLHRMRRQAKLRRTHRAAAGGELRADGGASASALGRNCVRARCCSQRVFAT